MIYEYDVVEKDENGKTQTVKKQVIVKSMPLYKQTKMLFFQRRFFGLIGVIDRRFCQICREGTVVKTMLSKTGLTGIIKTIFMRDKIVNVCERCGIVKPVYSKKKETLPSGKTVMRKYVEEDNTRFGYELLESMMQYILIDALRDEDNKTAIMNEMDLSQRFDVMALYLGLQFKRSLNYDSIKAFDIISGIMPEEEEQEEKKKRKG